MSVSIEIVEQSTIEVLIPDCINQTRKQPITIIRWVSLNAFNIAIG